MALSDLIKTDFSKPLKAFRVIGIDLGTTKSTVADFSWVPEGEPKLRCLEVDQETLSQGRATHILVPSMVAIYANKKFVGEGAKRLRAEATRHKLELYKNIFWECKNHMGLNRTYHKAPAGYTSAKNIASHILSFLVESAENVGEAPILRTVITVPASFQAAQRQDTLDAALLAGINISTGDLLDEPMAAFLDYLYRNGTQIFNLQESARHLLVFDFGGGTCDVAIFRVSSKEKNIEVSPLSVSRYYRLGGGDIDKAIVYEVLIPQLIKQNKLKEFDLGFNEKSRFIEPAFLSLAELLKVGLCREIATRRSFSKDSKNNSELKKSQPGVYSCSFKDGRELKIESPSLTSQEFEKLLEPFLDRDFLFARETEYRMTASIFGPITDSLHRAGLKEDQIDFCIMAGGSTMIPQVQDAITLFFQQGKVLYFKDPDATQAAVASGAACQALSLALSGKGIIKTVSSDSISIQTASGPLTLIEKGITLPFPASDSWKEIENLIVPESSAERKLAIRIELLNSDNRVLASCPGEIMPPVKRGQRLLFRYRIDENQIFHFELSLADKNKTTVVKESLSNPLTNSINPNEKREEIDRIEEEIRNNKVSAEDINDSMIKLSELHVDIGQNEKALGILQALLASQGPDGYILNRMGIICGEIGDLKKEERFYIEAARIDNDSDPLFNLALSKKNQGKHEEALKIITKAISSRKKPPYLTLKAMILHILQRADEKTPVLDEALKIFDPISTLDDWELGWYLTAAQLAGDNNRKAEAENEQRSRIAKSGVKRSFGFFPELKI